MTPSNPSTSYTETFELLASERRREVLRALRGREEPLPVEELATMLACGDRDQRDPNGRRRIEAELTHRHIPKRAERGVVTYESRAVAYRGDEFVDTLLELPADEAAVTLG